MEYSSTGNNKEHNDLKKILMLTFVIIAIILIASGIYWYFSRNITTNAEKKAPLTENEKMEQLNYLASMQNKTVSEDEQSEGLDILTARSNTDSSDDASREEKIRELDLLTKKNN